LYALACKLHTPPVYEYNGTVRQQLLTLVLALLVFVIPGHDLAEYRVGPVALHQLLDHLQANPTLHIPSYIDGSKLDNRTPEKMKLALDNELTDVLRVARALVMDHIEQPKPEDALMLYGYSDGDNAPYNSAAIFLVLHTNLREMDESGGQTEDYLTKLWGCVLGVDEMQALLSCIANRQL